MLLYQETTCFAALVALYLHIWDGRTDLSNSRFAFQSDRRGDARPSGQIPPTFLHEQVGGYMGSDNLRLPCVQPPTSSYNLQIAYEQPPTSSCSAWSMVMGGHDSHGGHGIHVGHGGHDGHCGHGGHGGYVGHGQDRQERQN